MYVCVCITVCTSMYVSRDMFRMIVKHLVFVFHHYITVGATLAFVILGKSHSCTMHRKPAFAGQVVLSLRTSMSSLDNFPLTILTFTLFTLLQSALPS